MHTFGTRNGVNFRITHEGNLDLKTLAAINKMVELLTKPKTNEQHRQAVKKDQN